MYGDAIISNAIISGFIIVIIYFLDRAEKEPPLFICKLYFISILATALFGKLKFFLLGLTGFDNHTFSNLIESFIEAGLVEETLKLSVFMLLVWKSNNFNEEMDGLVYFMIIAAGFAVMENINYTRMATYGSPHAFYEVTGTTEGYSKAIIKILFLRYHSGHVIFGIMMGFFAGKAKFAQSHTKKLLFTGFILSVLIHGCWDYIARDYFYLYFTTLLILALMLIIKVQGETKYKKIHQNLFHLINNNISLAKESKMDKKIIKRLNQLKERLILMNCLEGKQQDSLSKLIYDRFPDPITDFVLEDNNGINERLCEISAELPKTKNSISKIIFMYISIVLPSTLLIAFIV